MKCPQNVLHYIWHTSRVYVIHIKSLSRYFQLTQNWTDKAKWRSIEASNKVNKHTGHGLLTSLPRINFALVKFNSTDGSTWQFVHSAAVPMALLQTRRVSSASGFNMWNSQITKTRGIITNIYWMFLRAYFREFTVTVYWITTIVTDKNWQSNFISNAGIWQFNNRHRVCWIFLLEFNGKSKLTASQRHSRLWHDPV